MKKRHQPVKAILLVLASASVAVAGVKIEKKPFFNYPFQGAITDISLYHSGTNQNILILSQANGVLIDAHKNVQQRLSFKSCFDTKASQIGDDGPCIIYCPGGGFSRIWAMDLSGKELWHYGESNRLHTAVRDAQGLFYVYSFVKDGSILDSKGELVSRFGDRLIDVFFANQATILTIAKDNTRRFLEFRDRSFNPTRAFPIEKGAFKVIAYNWPQSNDLCYATYDRLVCMNQKGNTTKRLRFGFAAAIHNADGVIIQDDKGERYLALLTRTAGKSKSKLCIIGKNFEKLYEEKLPMSLAVSTLGTTNRLFVGIGTTDVFEYQIRDTSQDGGVQR